MNIKLRHLGYKNGKSLFFNNEKYLSDSIDR